MRASFDPLTRRFRECDMLDVTASAQCCGNSVRYTNPCISSPARRRTGKARDLQVNSSVDLNTTRLHTQSPRLQRHKQLRGAKLRTMATPSSTSTSDDFPFLMQVALEAAETGAKVRSRSLGYLGCPSNLNSFPLLFRLCTRLWRSRGTSTLRE